MSDPNGQRQPLAAPRTVQSAWAATRKSNCYLAVLFYRKAGRQGIRKAIVATAHRILTSVFCMLRDQTNYREVGGDYFDQISPAGTRDRLTRRWQRFGLQVVVQPSTERAARAPGSRKNAVAPVNAPKG